MVLLISLKNSRVWHEKNHMEGIMLQAFKGFYQNGKLELEGEGNIKKSVPILVTPLKKIGGIICLPFFKTAVLKISYVRKDGAVWRNQLLNDAVESAVAHQLNLVTAPLQSYPRPA